MKIGYARVSTDEQNLDLQRAALEGAAVTGCLKVEGPTTALLGRCAFALV